MGSLKDLPTVLLYLACTFVTVSFGQTQLYHKENITECDPQSPTIHINLTDETPVGLVSVDLARNSGQDVCNINVQVTVSTNKMLKVDVLSGDDNFLSDTQTDCGVTVTTSDDAIPDLGICRKSGDGTIGSDGNQTRSSYQASGKSVDISIEISDLESQEFQLMVEAYSKSTTGNCFPCAKSGSVCIHGDLTCDGLQNCPDGEDESFEYTRDKSCPLVCDEGKQVIGRSQICDGSADCVDGLDEERRTCGPKPWSSLSVFDITVAVMCLVLLILMFAFCMWYSTHPPDIKKYKKKQKALQKRREQRMKIEQMRALAKETDENDEAREEPRPDDGGGAVGPAPQYLGSAEDQVNQGTVQSYL
ncbi:uncharacterized protein [Ptychodera flava]|uniref:uncharacterized protein n=1 Tax=Ptychodera flava TaxID=63121 RepID=UPI003969BF92